MWWLYPPAVGLIIGGTFYALIRYRRPPETRLVALIAGCIVGLPITAACGVGVYLMYNP